MATTSRIPEILSRHEEEILTEWVRQQMMSTSVSTTLISATDLREQSAAFLSALRKALASGTDLQSPEWTAARDFLTEISSTRARQGFTPKETATFIFSLKRPLFSALDQEYGSDAKGLAREIWTATELLDELGLETADAYQKTREEVIVRQQQELLELSTPVVKLWDGILALPMIGTLDSNRTQVVMETLLQQIVKTGAAIAIIDITGVPTVDTLVAQHLMKTVAAARLMGADCIISGVRPQIAQTIVHLGVELGDMVTKATLADALRAALKRTKQWVGDTEPAK